MSSLGWNDARAGFVVSILMLRVWFASIRMLDDAIGSKPSLYDVHLQII